MRISFRAMFAGFLAALAFAAFAIPSEANAPVAVSFSNTFPDVNPCTGLVHQVTISGTAFIHDNNGAQVVTADRTITTSTGYIGRGTSTFVMNQEIGRFSLHDTLVSASNSRIRAAFTIVVDLDTGTVKVVHGAVTCERP